MSAKTCDSIEDLQRFLVQDQGKSMLGQIDFSDFVVQEKLEGDEYFVDTVSLNGKHSVVSAHAYRKDLFKGSPVYRHIEILQHESPKYKPWHQRGNMVSL